MAKFGFDYKVDAENTENQGGGDFEVMPEMYARLEVSAAELKPTKDEKGTQAVLVIDIVEPEEFKGRKMWAYWTIQHADGQDNKQFAKFGKPMFDRLCRAVDVPEPEDTDDLLFKTFVAKVGISKGGDKPGGGKYSDKNEIKTFFYDDEPDKMPEVGIIGGGAANDNRASANDNASSARSTQSGGSTATKPAAAAGNRPWKK